MGSLGFNQKPFFCLLLSRSLGLRRLQWIIVEDWRMTALEPTASYSCDSEAQHIVLCLCICETFLLGPATCFVAQIFLPTWCWLPRLDLDETTGQIHQMTFMSASNDLLRIMLCHRTQTYRYKSARHNLDWTDTNIMFTSLTWPGANIGLSCSLHEHFERGSHGA